MDNQRNDGFLSIVENDNKSTPEVIVVASAIQDNNCDCYDCDYNCQECDNS